MSQDSDNRGSLLQRLAESMVLVKGGTFTMGAAKNDFEAYNWEKPTHKVTLSDFYISKYEVTQALWEAVMGDNPSSFRGRDFPVENVSWDEIQKFISKLNALTNIHYRLPTEAEWEFAARGGNESKGLKYCGSDSLGDVAWYRDNSGSKTHPVGQKAPNELGLFDMLGNVWEWCSDFYSDYSDEAEVNPEGVQSGARRVYRGACWLDQAKLCRISSRGNNLPDSKINIFGFRLARSCDGADKVGSEERGGSVRAQEVASEGRGKEHREATEEGATGTQGKAREKGALKLASMVTQDAGEVKATAGSEEQAARIRELEKMVGDLKALLEKEQRISSETVKKVQDEVEQNVREVEALKAQLKAIHREGEETEKREKTLKNQETQPESERDVNEQAVEEDDEGIKSHTDVPPRKDPFASDMVYVQGGTFMMGATSEQGSDAYSDERPTHQVTVPSFYISKYEVTQKQWVAIMGSNPSHFQGDNLPVECVSWNDVKKFIEELNAKTGKNYRLPTEAEWEYAARGGNKSRGYKYSGSNTLGDVAWYDGNSGSKTHPVGQKRANELGLYDMSGNVWEWCSDWYEDYESGAQVDPKGPLSGSCRVLRGGGWRNNARYCRVSYRRSFLPDFRFINFGFRLARSL